ncbi:hypothetical protein S83_008715 [Arachis hypogaea]
MATSLQMSPQVEQILGEIRDNFRFLANGFQRLDKIKDSNRQSKQLEELKDKMVECKKHFCGCKLVILLYLSGNCNFELSKKKNVGSFHIDFTGLVFLMN